ncbi:MULTISPECIES: IS5 family transposase [unclassified Inquilinus]|jgi:IS5 family transposase|uniref:IS5 family transposase n=1 Tax=unclassified Inquilinus TaxID=2645927 RepID=UPI003F8EE35E
MSRREVGQLSLADSLVSGVGANGTLDRLSELIGWPALGELVSPLDPSRLGAPGYPALVLLKALLLQQWHGLSDPGLEAALADRLSFRRFCGFALDDKTPDHVTIHRFREGLRRHGLAERVFEEVNRQIDQRELILRRGTLIDASLVEAAVKRPPKPAAEEIPAEAAEGGAPAPVRPASKLVRSAVDPEAAWTKKGGRRYFGYKAHVGVDQGSGIIRRQRLTPANVNDTVEADALICGDEAAVYADEAYTTHERREALREQGIKDRMMHRPNKHHPLTPRQIQHNRAIGRRRAPVEQVFAQLKRLCGWSRVRYYGVASNAVHLALLCTALNLKRLVVLTTPKTKSA